jgi:hypothetical protein
MSNCFRSWRVARYSVEDANRIERMRDPQLILTLI